MRAYIQSKFFRQSAVLLTVMPLLLISAMGHLPERSLLKESLSVITILALYQLIGQFFWARTNTPAVKQLTMGRLVKYHKFIGYTFIGIMFFHPLYVVVPRFFEAGVSPVDAFITIITTMNQGIVLGIIAWCLMLALGVTSLVRRRLPMSYKNWRILHGILAALFVSVAVWHAIDLGRHSNLLMSLLLSILAVGGVILLVKTYIFKKIIKPVDNK